MHGIYNVHVHVYAGSYISLDSMLSVFSIENTTVRECGL